MSTENSSALIPLVLSNCSRKKYKLLEVKDSSGAGFEIGRFKFPRWHRGKAEVATIKIIANLSTGRYRSDLLLDFDREGHTTDSGQRKASE